MSDQINLEFEWTDQNGFTSCADPNFGSATNTPILTVSHHNWGVGYSSGSIQISDSHREQLSLVSDQLKEMHQHLMLIAPRKELLERHPALANAYNKYLMILKLVGEEE